MLERGLRATCPTLERVGTSIRAASARYGASGTEQDRTGGVFWQKRAAWRGDGVGGVGVLTDSHIHSGPRSVNALAVTPLYTILHENNFFQMKSYINFRNYFDTGGANEIKIIVIG